MVIVCNLGKIFMRTLLFRSLKSSKISFHLFEDEFHNDFNFHKPTILDLKPLSLKCLSGSLIKHGIQTDCSLADGRAPKICKNENICTSTCYVSTTRSIAHATVQCFPEIRKNPWKQAVLASAHCLSIVFKETG